MAKDFYPDGISKLVKVLILSDRLKAAYIISRPKFFKSQISNRVPDLLLALFFIFLAFGSSEKACPPPLPPLFMQKLI